MSNKKWDNDVAEFLFPKGLLIRIVVTIGICLLIWLFISTVESGRERKKATRLETVKEDMQVLINKKQFSEAEDLLKSFISDYGSSDETEEIAADMLNIAAYGCWKGYGEWKTEIHDSSGECFQTTKHQPKQLVLFFIQRSRKMEYLEIKITNLVPAAYNPGKALKPGDKVYERIKNTISAFGYVDPVIDRDPVIVKRV